MVGSVTAAIDSTVRTPRRSISSTTRSLWTTCPRMAPRPPAAAKRFTFRSAMRTPEQKPYLAARLMIIRSGQRRSAREHSRFVELQSALHGRPRTVVHPPLRDAVGVRVHHLFLGVPAPSRHSPAHQGPRRIDGRGGMVSDRLHALQRVLRAGDGDDRGPPGAAA